MLTSPRKIWRLLRATKVTTYILLMLGPMFIRPLAFIRHPHQSQPAYAKLPGLWGTPLAVAGVCAAAAQSIYQWMFWREMDKPSPAKPPADLLLQLHKTEGRYFWMVFALTALLVYALASLRWGYHYGAIHVIRKWRPELSKPPLKYFVVTTAAWGLWLSLYITGIVYGLWNWKTQGDVGEFFNTYVQTHQVGALVAVLIIGSAMKLAGRNSELGMKALYGGSKWLSMLVDVIGIGVMVLLMLFVTRL
ncbi:hypothetical protein [Pseudomonas sp. MWU13-2105]|uniref:hypothetical protein n=1 Tax=Pseudomonas sp. MWU13-2105 TaxID=2935074 RepID=UPI0020100CC2|nr:hypothetical protein [Pseudomonas sp. MWU13-2105]